MNNTEKLVTVGFKVPVSVKQQIEKTAKKSGLDTSSYLRSIFIKKHEHINKRASIPNELVFDDTTADEMLTLIEKLQRKYPDKSSYELILAALKMAKGHEKLLLTEKIKKFF